MRIGIFGGDDGRRRAASTSWSRPLHAVADQGFAAYWLPQIFGVDALTALAVVGREVPGIELGTAVVPTYPRGIR